MANTAFVFVKPHAVTEGVKDLVLSTLTEKGCKVECWLLLCCCRLLPFPARGMEARPRCLLRERVHIGAGVVGVDGRHVLPSARGNADARRAVHTRQGRARPRGVRHVVAQRLWARGWLDHVPLLVLITAHPAHKQAT